MSPTLVSTGISRLSPICFLFFFLGFYCVVLLIALLISSVPLPLWVSLLLNHSYSNLLPCIMVRSCVEFQCLHQLGCFQYHHFLYVVCLYQQCRSWVSTGFILIVGFSRLVVDYLVFMAVLEERIGVGRCIR